MGRRPRWLHCLSGVAPRLGNCDAARFGRDRRGDTSITAERPFTKEFGARMKPSNGVFRLVAAVLVGAAALGAAVHTKRDHLWPRVAGAAVYIGGRLSRGSSVYQQDHHRILAYVYRDIDGPSGRASLWYVVPLQGTGVALTTSEIWRFPGMALCRDAAPHLDLYPDARCGIEPRLDLSPNAAEFTTEEDRRVRVVLPAPVSRPPGTRGPGPRQKPHRPPNRPRSE